MNESILNELLSIQKNEITEYYVYKKMAEYSKDEKHKEILIKIANEELEHYSILKKITGRDVLPDSFKIMFYTFISKILGMNFGLKLMESGEDNAQDVYSKLDDYPELKKLAESEKEHENKLISLIEEDILDYVSSIVLGLNDALVELTGALCGFTLALNNSKIVAIVGAITGIAASMSMAVSQYLSVKNEDSEEKHPVKASLYTGISYIFTVVLLIMPYLIFDNIFVSLAFVIIFAILIIAIFNFYTAVAKNLSFKSRFLEMAFLSLIVAAINFGIGYFMKITFNIDV